MRQKVLIKLPMIKGEKSRSKALQIAVGVSGVESAGLQGQDKNQIEVTGDGVDVVKLTTLLRKKMVSAELISVSQIVEKKEGSEEKVSSDSNKNEDTVTLQPLVSSYGETVPCYVYEVYNYGHSDPTACSIL